MNDKNDFDTSSDDEFYDDALDDNFELDDEGYDDLDLESELGESEYGEDDLLDDWDEDGKREKPLPPPQEKKPKFGLSFNTIVIIGALIFGVFIVVSQVQKERATLDIDNPPEVDQPTALRMEGAFQGPGGIPKKEVSNSGTPSVSKEANKEPEDEKGFLFDEDILSDPKEVVDNAPPMPTPITSEEDGVIEQQEGNVVVLSDDDALDEIKERLEQEKELVRDIQQTPRAPDPVDVVVLKETQDKQPIANEVAQDQENILEKAISVENGQSASLNQKLDAIIQRLESMENKINEIENSNDEKIEAITTNLDSLKKKGEVSVSPSPSPTVVTKQEVKEPETPKVEKVKQPTKVVKKRTPKKAAKPVKWELRAAQPGKAWVSRRGQKNMQPVVVGDKLTGIGRIQSIQHLKGRWIVQGSTGKITQ